MTSFNCNHSFTYVLRVITLDVTERRRESAGKKSRKKKKARGATNCLSQIPSEKNNKTGLSGCGSFIVAYLRPATSIDRLHLDQGMISYRDHAPRILRTMGHVIWRLSAEYNGDYGPSTMRTTHQRLYGLYGLQTKGFTDYTKYRPKVLRTMRTTDQRFYGLYGRTTHNFH